MNDRTPRAVHYGWEKPGQTVSYRFAGSRTFRVVDVKTADKYMIVPDKNYAPKGGVRSRDKWIKYKDAMKKAGLALENKKPGNVLSILDFSKM